MELNNLKAAYKDGLLNGFDNQDAKSFLTSMMLTFGEMSVYDLMDFDDEIMAGKYPYLARLNS